MAWTRSPKSGRVFRGENRVGDAEAATLSDTLEGWQVDIFTEKGLTIITVHGVEPLTVDETADRLLRMEDTFDELVKEVAFMRRQGPWGKSYTNRLDALIARAKGKADGESR